MGKKKIIQTDKAPAAIGPYSQAVVANGFLFISGQIPLDPVTMEIVGDSAEEQTEQVLKNIEAILHAARLDVASVVKTTILLTDINDFSVVNEQYGKVFKKDYPARATYQVAALPKGARIELEAVAVLS
ncbi:MAG: RidA family protein [Desulfobulbaceae bacterium]|nr:RidA family protein [Desulfobulbaceae bacterium]